MAVKGVKDVMNKAKVMTATATLVAGLGVASHVNADEVDLSSTTQNSEAQANQTESNVTKADVNAAKADLDTANQAVSHQEQVVSDAATAADEAQSTYNQAQQSTNEAQNLVDQATPENIASAQDDVNLAQEQVSQADNAERVAENTVAQAQEAVNAQTAVVDEAQSAVDTAQSDVDAAQKDVNEKQAILDGTGQAEIIANRDKAQADVNSVQKQVTQAESDLTKAQEADANRQQAIDNAQTAVGEANQTVTSTKSDLDAKTAKAQQTAQALTDAQSAYKTAENDYKAINTITMSDEYAKALKDAYDYSLTTEQRAVARNTLASLAKSEASKNKFIHNENDKKQSFDINHVTAEQAQELSLFAAELINQARKAVGTPLVEVTVDSATEAQNHANYYATTDMTTWTFNHDTTDLDVKYTWVDEDWAGGLGLKQVSNLDEAKERIYQNALVAWIFNENEWLHASSVVGTRGAVAGKSYIGIGFSKLKDGGDSINLNIFNTEYSNLSNFDTTALSNPKSAENVVATYNAAQSDLAQAQVENTTAQTAKTSAQTAYDNAVSNLSSASATLTQAQSVAIQMPTAKANLASAQSTLKQAQENLVKAQKAVDDLSADIAVKQANLASAKQVLSTKQATLATKQATLTTEQNRLVSLQNSLATAQANVLKAKENVVTAKDNLTKVQTYLTRLQNAPALLVQAQRQEATAKANLLAALDTLEAELLKLKDLQVKQAVAQAVYDTTSKAYQTILDAQEKQRLQDEYNAIIAQGKTPVAIVDETGKIVSYQAEDSQTTIQSSSVESTAVKAQIKPVEEVSVVTASALPMTGEHSSVLAVLFGCLMTIWGLVGVRKQKQ